MKKILLLAGALVAMSSAAYAEGEGAQGQVDVSGGIIVPLQVTDYRGITLPDNLQRGQAFEMVPQNAGPNAGMITFSGDAGDQIVVSYGNDGVDGLVKFMFQNGQGANLHIENEDEFNLMLLASCGDAPESSVNIGNGGVNGLANLGANGLCTFWFGASTGVGTLPNNMQRGSYEGEFTVMAGYVQ